MYFAQRACIALVSNHIQHYIYLRRIYKTCINITPGYITPGYITPCSYDKPGDLNNDAAMKHLGRYGNLGRYENHASIPPVSSCYPPLPMLR